MTEPHAPKLAAPGAGLPWVELWIGRLMFSRKLRTATREGIRGEFGDERTRIRRLIGSFEADGRGRRVLIKRLRGLEDSSRNWSPWMTLDHLRICNDLFAGVIHGLANGRVPKRPASTAAVKPSADVDERVEEAFERSCDGFLDTVGGLGDLDTPQRFAHPWFGPLDAAGWHALAAVHMGIHRRQLEAIAEAGVKRPGDR